MSLVEHKNWKIWQWTLNPLNFTLSAMGYESFTHKQKWNDLHKICPFYNRHVKSWLVAMTKCQIATFGVHFNTQLFSNKSWVPDILFTSSDYVIIKCLWCVGTIFLNPVLQCGYKAIFCHHDTQPFLRIPPPPFPKSVFIVDRFL